jgi:hypothetical protein
LRSHFKFAEWTIFKLVITDLWINNSLKNISVETLSHVNLCHLILVQWKHYGEILSIFLAQYHHLLLSKKDTSFKLNLEKSEKRNKLSSFLRKTKKISINMAKLYIYNFYFNFTLEHQEKVVRINKLLF